MSAGGLPPVPGEAHDPEDRVAALERGLAAVVERIERLEVGAERLFTPDQYDDLVSRLQAVRGNAEKDRVFAEWVEEISA